MKIFQRFGTYGLYAAAILLFSGGLFLWVRKDSDTNKDVDTNTQIVSEVKRAVEALERDHDGQDALLTCLFNVLARQEKITRVEIEGCVIETAVPPKTGEGTEPASPTGDSSQLRDSQASGASSFPNGSAQNDPGLTETPQEPEEPEPPQPPEPPQSLLPFVDKPLIGCSVRGLCI